MTTATDELLDALDPDQRVAVIAPPEPLKVVAGAGSGKTRVMTYRVAWQIREQIVKPEEAFVSAFTKSAANEMRDRLNMLIDGGSVEVGTFHSICFRLLQTQRENDGLPRYDVCTEGERTRILRDLLGKPSREFPQALNMEVDIAEVGGYISAWKNRIIHDDDEQIFETLEEAPRISSRWAAAKAYGYYEQHLAIIGKLDFDDMLLKTYDLLATKEAALAVWQSRWTAYFVDEAQDTNLVQWAILKLLAPPSTNPNLTIVGDTRQALYRFRGAVPELMDDFHQAYPKAAQIDLTLNYRSTPQVIQRANMLVKALSLPDQAEVRPHGAEAITGFFHDEMDQAVEIASFVTEARSEGHKGGEIAVLIRTNAQSASIERAFVASNIPYWCKNGGFFERMEVGDMVAYLRLAYTRNDEASLRRIINKPTRYLGAAFCDAAVDLATRSDGDLVTAISRVMSTRGKALSRKQAEARTDLANLLNHINPLDPEMKPLGPSAAISRTLGWTEYKEWLKKNNGSNVAADESREENLMALISVAASFGTLEAFMQFIQTSNDLQRESNDATEISTVHRAKGREWPFVIVSNFYNGSFPHKRAVEEGHLNDERRVAYVAATRARDVLIFAIPAIDSYEKPADPSPFLRDMELASEIDEDKLDQEWWGDVFKSKGA